MKRGVWLPKDAEPPVIPTGFHILPRRWWWNAPLPGWVYRGD